MNLIKGQLYAYAKQSRIYVAVYAGDNAGLNGNVHFWDIAPFTLERLKANKKPFVSYLFPYDIESRVVPIEESSLPSTMIPLYQEIKKLIG